MDLIPYDFVSAAMMLSNVVPAFPPSPSQPAKGTLPEHRLCNACGVRDLPGKHRYQLGERWDDEFGIWHVRCVRCEKIKVAQREKGEVCFGCWSEETEGERGEIMVRLGQWRSEAGRRIGSISEDRCDGR